MKIRSRLFLAFLILVGVGFYVLVHWISDDLRPRHMRTMEEAMVDTATILSSMVARHVEGDTIVIDDIRAAFQDARSRSLKAQIYELTKTRLRMRVYITDRHGTVVFDSDDGRAEGEDYSKWNDVLKTLHGHYGARTTRTDPDDPRSSILYVASPIRVRGKILGVLTVCKPSDSVTLFMETSSHEIMIAGGLAALAVVLLGMAISSWITQPIERLTRYAHGVRDGRRQALPKLGRSEIGLLGKAFEEMRDALEGKRYVEKYVQTLTHEMKSPLSAIHGAAELLQEEMPGEQRARFLANIHTEVERAQNLVDRLLQLSALENRKGLLHIQEIPLGDLIQEVVESVRPLLTAKEIATRVTLDRPAHIEGERFLVRQALANLLQNAIDFSRPGGTIAVDVASEDRHALITISDTGAGIPDYAQGKLFDRFFSLQRPDTGKKSSGLGLTLVHEVAKLHAGQITVANRPGGGASAILRLPFHPPQAA